MGDESEGWHCKHCGRWKNEATRKGSTDCAPPFKVQPHVWQTVAERMEAIYYGR